MHLVSFKEIGVYMSQSYSSFLDTMKLELVDDVSLPSTQLEDHFGAMAWYKVDGNEKKLIGDESGFDLTFEDPRYTGQVGETTVRYQLFTPLSEPETEEERVPALLIRRTTKDLVMLGRVTLPLEKLGGWATGLVVQDLKKSGGPVEKKDVERPSPAELTPSSMAESVLRQVELVAESGLHKVYASHNDYLCDLFADLPWSDPERTDSLKWLLGEGRARLEQASKRIEARNGPSYLGMFQESLDHPEAGEGGSSITQSDRRWMTRK